MVAPVEAHADVSRAAAGMCAIASVAFTLQVPSGEVPAAADITDGVINRLHLLRSGLRCHGIDQCAQQPDAGHHDEHTCLTRGCCVVQVGLLQTLG